MRVAARSAVRLVVLINISMSVIITTVIVWSYCFQFLHLASSSFAAYVLVIPVACNMISTIPIAALQMAGFLMGFDEFNGCVYWDKAYKLSDEYNWQTWL